MINSSKVIEAYNRIKNFTNKTALIESELLNKSLNHRIIFKIESQQKTGAYKFRGAINSILSLKEQNILPKDFVAYSSGNHAQALACAAAMYNAKTTIFMPKYTSIIKQKSAESYGANVILTESRIEAEEKVLEFEKKNYYNLHPSSNDMVIAGNGTICYESIIELKVSPDAIFAPCGGGGLLSGTYIASSIFSDNILVYGGEPQNANDAFKSIKCGNIFKFSESPKTIADGARTLAITEKIFDYMKKIAGIYEIEEKEIIYWMSWIMHLLKIVCEPTAALAMAAAAKWLSEQKSSKTIIVIISGGNTDNKAYNNMGTTNYLEYFPSMNMIHNINNI